MYTTDDLDLRIEVDRLGEGEYTLDCDCIFPFLLTTGVSCCSDWAAVIATSSLLLADVLVLTGV